MAQPKAPQVSFAQAPTPPGPSNVTAQLIHTVGGIAGEAVKGIQQGRLQQSFQDTAEAAKTVTDVSQSLADQGASQEQIDNALQKTASFDPAKDSIDTLDGMKLSDPVKNKLIEVKKRAGSAYNSIAQARAQGALTENAAALQLEATTRRLMHETPGFGPEIQQLARELAGYDPTNYDLQQILDVNKPKTHTLTASEKMSQEADAIVSAFSGVGRNIDKKDVIYHMAEAKVNETTNNALKYELSNHDIGFAQYVNATADVHGPDLGKTLTLIAGMTKEKGGITQPQQYVNLVIQQREDAKNELRKTAAEMGVSQDELDKGLSALDKQYEPVIKSTQDNALGKILDTQLDETSKLARIWGKQALPNLTRLVDAFPNSNIPSQVISMMANASDPNSFNLLLDFYPGLKALIKNGVETPKSVANKMSQATIKILNGEELSSEDMKYEPLAERAVLSQPNAGDLREKYIDKLSEQAPVRAASLLATSVPRSNARPGEVKYLKRQYDLFVGRQDGTDNPTLVDNVAKDIPKDRLNSLKVEMQKKTITTGWDYQHGTPITTTRTVPVITFDNRVKYTSQGVETYSNAEPLPDSLRQLQVFVNATSNGYGKDFGVDPNTFAQTLVNRIKMQGEMAGTVDRTPAQ